VNSIRYIFLYIHWMTHCLSKRLAGQTTLAISFVSKGFPYEDQVAELFIVTISFFIFPKRDIVNSH